jgi:hypothetical protein
VKWTEGAPYFLSGGGFSTRPSHHSIRGDLNLRPQAFLPIRRSVTSAYAAFAMRPSSEPPRGLSDPCRRDA